MIDVSAAKAHLSIALDTRSWTAVEAAVRTLGAEVERPAATRRTITLAIDPEVYEAETGRSLTDTVLTDIGYRINEGVALHVAGYEGWRIS